MVDNKRTSFSDINIVNGVLMLKKRIVDLISKIKKKLSDGTIESEHYLAIAYCMGIFIPIMITRLSILLIFSSSAIFWKTVEIITSTGINFFCLYMFVKKMIYYFREKRLMLGFLSMPIVTIFLLYSLSWLTILLGNFTNMMSLILGDYDQLIMHPEENLIEAIDSTRVIAQNMIIFSQIVGISFLLNTFVPEALQKVVLPVKLRFLRLLIKILSLTMMGVIIWLLINTGRDQFFAVTAIYGVIFALATPKLIGEIFSNISNLENKSISPEINRSFSLFKFFLGEFYSAWVISICVYGSDATNRVNLFSIVSLILVFSTVGIKLFLQSKNKDFSTWFVDKKNIDDSQKKKEEKYIE